MLIDGRTLLFALAAICLFLGALVLSLERRLNHPMPGLRRWSHASFVIGAGAALNALRGLVPPWIPVTLGLPLLIGGQAIALAALLEFEGRRVPARALAALWAAAATAIVIGLLVWPSFVLRSVAITSTLCLLTGAAAATVLARRPLTLSHALLGFSMAGLAVVNFSRLLVTASLPGPAGGGVADFNTPGIAIYTAATVLLQLACGMGFVLMITERMHDLVVQAARHDHLTGVLARGALFNQAQLDLQRARRQQTATAAFIVDVDHFKAINDTHGHATGDAVLRHVAWLGQHVLRCTDLFGRYGGDEFVAVMPATDLLTAAAIAERLRLAVAHDAEAQSGQLPAVTISIGVAALAPGDHTVEALVAQADQALYNAKRAGRNRTRVADTAEAPDKLSLRVLQSRR